MRATGKPVRKVTGKWNGKIMFERFIEHDAHGKFKGLTLEWKCPTCEGLNFKILIKGQRNSGIYRARCRYCKAKYRVNYPLPDGVIEGEAEFLERISREGFSSEEQVDLISDFAEIEYLKRDNASAGVIKEKQKALEDKIAFMKKRRRL
jgi:rubredoxin